MRIVNIWVCICIVNTCTFNSGLVKNYQLTTVSHSSRIYGGTMQTFLHFLLNSWKALWVLYYVPLFTLRKLKLRKGMQKCAWLHNSCVLHYIYLSGPNTLFSLLSPMSVDSPQQQGLGLSRVLFTLSKEAGLVSQLLPPSHTSIIKGKSMFSLFGKDSWR